MEKLTTIYIIYSAIFMLYFAFRWSMKNGLESLIKISLFISFCLAFIIILYRYKLLNFNV